MIVMVTGADGYIGSHCSLALMDSGYDVISLDNHSTGRAESSEILSMIKTKGKFLGIYVLR